MPYIGYVIHTNLMGNSNHVQKILLVENEINFNNIIYLNKIMDQNNMGLIDNFEISNTYEQSCRWNPYWEILYADLRTNIYHDYASISNRIVHGRSIKWTW